MFYEKSIIKIMNFLILNKNTKSKLKVYENKKNGKEIIIYYFMENLFYFTFESGMKSEARIEFEPYFPERDSEWPYINPELNNVKEECIKRIEENKEHIYKSTENDHKIFNEIKNANYIKLIYDFIMLKDYIKNKLCYNTHEHNKTLYNGEIVRERRDYYLFNRNIIVFNTFDKAREFEEFYSVGGENFYEFYILRNTKEVQEKFNYIDKNYQKIITQSKIEQF